LEVLGTQLKVTVDNSTIAIDPTTGLHVKADGITKDMIASVKSTALDSNYSVITAAVGLKQNVTTAILGNDALPLTITPDWEIIPRLKEPNTFTKQITLDGQLASTSQDSGTLVVKGGVGVQGDIHCSNTFNWSDERLKKDVETIPNALDVVSTMRGCFFTWNDQIPELEGTPAVGVIAQEMKVCAPLVVAHSDVSDLYSVEYSKTVPYLIEAIKALKRKVESLEAASAPVAAEPEPTAKRARKH
jgi:hypothetical protein